MEHCKISILLNNSTVSEFVTKKWIKVNDLSCGQSSVSKSIRFETLMFRSDLCDYSDAYIVVKGRISVCGKNANNRENKKLAFKNNAPFRSYISKINNAFIDTAEDLDVAMPNYSMASGSFWNYHIDEVNDNANENNTDNYRINNNKTINKSFKYRKKVIGNTPNINNTLEAEVVVPLKYLSNFGDLLICH